MTTKIDLNELEHGLDANLDARPTREESIALIARIRKLEAAVVRAAGCLQANSDKAARRHWAEGLLEDLAEGAVLP
jgi:hypothetical protein